MCVEGRRRPWRGAAEEAKKRRCSARRSCGAQLGALHAGEAMQPPGPGREDGFATGQVVGAGFAVAIDEGLIAMQGPTARRVPVTYSEARATAGASVVPVEVAVGLPSPLSRGIERLSQVLREPLQTCPVLRPRRDLARLAVPVNKMLSSEG